MNKIIRMWNQNRMLIIIIALVVVFFFIILRMLNGLAKDNNDKAIQNLLISQNKTQTEIENEESLPTESIITGETVKEETTNQNVNLIEVFTQKCNDNDIESAYDYLTEECKTILFPTKELFVSNYYNMIFTEKRTIKLENYKNSSKTNTYKVTFYPDNLVTGDTSGDKYQDYITINKETGKLNINSLIQSSDIISQSTVNGITVSVLRQDLYIDYEIYQIRVINDTEKTIKMDSRTSNQNIYVTGNNNVKYTAFANELANNLYEITQSGSKTYNLKFNKKYDASIRTKSITFNDVIDDYETYTQDKNNNRLKIKVEF